MTLKPNRHGPFTKGLAITNYSNDLRFFFFEVDLPYVSDEFQAVLDVYEHNGLDVLVHKTGNGWHFISPTLVTKEEWKHYHEILKGINKKCPMTTLRIEPNKYPQEREIWYIYDRFYYRFSDRPNSVELSNLLNKWFKTDFKGTITTELKLVRYPLP